MERKFRVLKGFCTIWKDRMCEAYNSGTTYTLTYNDSINYIEHINELLKRGFIEEILPDKKPILNEKSDSILDYEKKHNIHEAVHLMKNHDVTMIDSHFNIEWKFKNGYKTLLGAGYNTPIDDFFDENFGVFDLLDLTFMLVKSGEEVKDKWVRVPCNRSMCELIVQGKTIRVNGTIIEKDYTDSDIQRMFDNLEYGKVEYLEEN